MVLFVAFSTAFSLQIESFSHFLLNLDYNVMV